MTAFAFDNFTGSENDPLSASWTKDTKACGDTLLQDGHGAVYDFTYSGAGGLYYWNTAAPSPDYTVSAGLNRSNLSGDAYQFEGCVGRYRSADGACYTLEAFENATPMSELRLRVFNGASWTVLGANPMSLGLADVLMLSMSGSNIIGSVNGVPLITVTDTTVSAAGYAGIIASGQVTMCLPGAWSASGMGEIFPVDMEGMLAGLFGTAKMDGGIYG